MRSLEKFFEQNGGVLAELVVVGTKGGEKMGVNVEFAGSFTVDENRLRRFPIWS
jgi:hypothetical protein